MTAPLTSSNLPVLGDKWLWGPVGCSVLVYSQFLAMNASALFLSAFTVERYIAICHPMKAQVADADKLTVFQPP